MRARLTLFLQNAPVRQFYLDENRDYSVGRSQKNDVVIDDDEISRTHASLEYRDSYWSIKDLDSKNGVAVDARPVSSEPLRQDCWISLGELIARYELRTEAQVRIERSSHQSRYESSMEMRRHISPSTGVQPLMTTLLDSVVKLVGMERGFAMLARPDGDLEVIATIGGDGANDFKGSVGSINRALESQSSIVSTNVREIATLAERPSIIAGEIQALVCLPMYILDRTIGIVYADSRKVAHVLTDLDLEILEGLIGHATTALAAAQLDKEMEDIKSILNRADVDVARLSDGWSDLPGYKMPIGHPQAHQGETRVTWSRIAGNN